MKMFSYIKANYHSYLFLVPLSSLFIFSSFFVTSNLVLFVLVAAYALTVLEVKHNQNLLKQYETLLNKRMDLINGIAEDNIVKDRNYILCFMALSFFKAGKLFLEKKCLNSRNIILGFQLKNGNARFSIPEEELPETISAPVSIRNSKINYQNNYKLIEELLKEW